MLNASEILSGAPHTERYLFKPFFGSSHHWALSLLKGGSQGRRVLDIGPGGGAIGRELSGQSVQELVAVEIDEPTRALLAETYTEVYENIGPLNGRTFDTILLLDVLEHMIDPFAYLQALSPLAAPGAQVLISVPNVAHWSVRLSLLAGRFEYAARGILDRTHLQFFTRKRFLEMCGSIPGFEIEALSSSIAPLEHVLPKSISKTAVFSLLARTRYAAANALPGLLGYQHLALLRRRA
jgi:2-polyprenyl-3-methyl-5-hydroxy-6-metoxy-1,4-benzoquinol methylase